MKREFLDAYRAGKHAAEGFWDWKTVLIFAVALVISNLVEKWLMSRYSLSSLESFALSVLVILPVVMILIAVRGKLHI